MKRQLKRSVVYGLYIISFVLLLVGVLGLGLTARELAFSDKESEYKYVSKGIFDYEENIPVVNTELKLSRPYTDTDVKLVKNFYDYKANSEEQEKSLIYYEGIYMQSSGVSYSKGDVFDVVAIYDGKVKEIKKDETIGNMITIEHENGIVSVYESVTEILVKEGDTVTIGQALAKSGTSNLSTELGNHLYFELIIDGVCVNPENYYDKLINEL